MVKIISFFLPILWVCFTEVQCEFSVDPVWDPHVWPDTFEDDGKPFVEFTCEAYLKSHEWLSWYGTFNGAYCAKQNETYWKGRTQYWKKKTDTKTITFKKFEGEIDPSNESVSQLKTIQQETDFGYVKITLEKTLKLSDNGSVIYCAREDNKWIKKQSNNISITFKRKTALDQPHVIPDKFEDEHKPFMQFSCYAFLKPGQLLSWYQSKELTESAGSLLRMIQLQDPKTKEGEQTVLTLNKTLEPSDNGSEIYCAQQSVRPDGSFSDEKQTQRIALKIHRDIPPLEHPFIRVEPNNASVSFHVNTTLRLTCGGSKPVDGRTYTWFKKESESSLTVPKDQKYDASTNLNVLDLSLNESHNQNKLFCAQGFLSYIRHTDGSLHVKSYGKLAMSNIITLIQQEKDEEKQDVASYPNTAPWWVLGVVIAVASLWIILLSVVALRLRRKVHELESKIQADEAIRARAPCPPPEDPTYEQVYAHGAGLKRPRRK